MSHSIRGRKGKDATLEDMEENCKVAMATGKLIKTEFPFLNLYVPGDNDRIIQILYLAGRLSEEDILWADCEIVKNSDVLFAFMPNDYISNGMRKEINMARICKIPIMYFDKIDSQTIDRIRYFLEIAKRLTEKI